MKNSGLEWELSIFNGTQCQEPLSFSRILVCINPSTVFFWRFSVSVNSSWKRINTVRISGRLFTTKSMNHQHELMGCRFFCCEFSFGSTNTEAHAGNTISVINAGGPVSLRFPVVGKAM